MKNLAMLLMGAKKPSDDEEDYGNKDDEEDGGDDTEHLHSAAEELISAVKAGDAEKVVKALGAMHHLFACSEDEDEEKEDKGDKGDEEA